MRVYPGLICPEEGTRSRVELDGISVSFIDRWRLELQVINTDLYAYIDDFLFVLCTMTTSTIVLVTI